MERLPTGVSGLDRLLYGGLPPGELTLFYGEASTGKTLLALQCSLQAARRGLQVIYVDADGGFPAERLRRIAEETLTSNLLIFTPRNFYEQTRLVEELERYSHPRLGLVVFDTINSLYRLAASKPEILIPASKELNRQLAYLARFTKATGKPVLLTSQVRSVIGEELQAERVEPVAPRILRFWCSTILQLKSTLKPGVKAAFLERLEGKQRQGLFCHFKITDWGLE